MHLQMNGPGPNHTRPTGQGIPTRPSSPRHLFEGPDVPSARSCHAFLRCGSAIRNQPITFIPAVMPEDDLSEKIGQVATSSMTFISGATSLGSRLIMFAAHYCSGPLAAREKGLYVRRKVIDVYY